MHIFDILSLTLCPSSSLKASLIEVSYTLQSLICQIRALGSANALYLWTDDYACGIIPITLNIFSSLLGCTEVQFFFVIDVIRTALHSQGIGCLIFDSFEANIAIDPAVHLWKTWP